jgi:hypothetical protein
MNPPCAFLARIEINAYSYFTFPPTWEEQAHKSTSLKRNHLKHQGGSTRVYPSIFVPF